MSSAWVWLQFVLIWLPVWALYTSLILAGHPGVPLVGAALNGFWAILTAALLGLGVRRVSERLPWPHPFRWRFGAIHLLGALTYAIGFASITTVVQAFVDPHGPLHGGALFDARSIELSVATMPRLAVMGVWFYVMVASIVYASRGTERAARAEALAVRSQLAALRAQLNPHFLFNALHTVVQLIPREPQRAAQAAEHLAGLLRGTIEEERDLVSLEEEWAMVQRYLDLERIRFGDRLDVHADLSPDALAALVPSFALQTLVENAVRHGAAPKVDPTRIELVAHLEDDKLALTVRDTGVGSTSEALARLDGTGLRRLRSRLEALYGDRASLELASAPNEGCRATLTLPLTLAD